LSERFDRALVYASGKHRKQSRKASDVPYIAHLLAVASTVIEAGADEDTAIGALLHDVVEDQGGAILFTELDREFGSRVREIVEACSDSTAAEGEHKLDWQTRKQSYLAALPAHSKQAQLVSLADKLHNARSIVRDLKRVGPQAFQRFQGKRQGTLWYYAQLKNIFRDFEPAYLREEFFEAVDEMAMLSGTAREERYA
jgi:(p)ppGpp synthase/HD superfamily hydrolase